MSKETKKVKLGAPSVLPKKDIVCIFRMVKDLVLGRLDINPYNTQSLDGLVVVKRQLDFLKVMVSFYEHREKVLFTHLRDDDVKVEPKDIATKLRVLR